MRVWLRVLGLDLFDLSVSTDDVVEEIRGGRTSST
jgi:hypothetical protein